MKVSLDVSLTLIGGPLNNSDRAGHASQELITGCIVLVQCEFDIHSYLGRCMKGVDSRIVGHARQMEIANMTEMDGVCP